MLRSALPVLAILILLPCLGAAEKAAKGLLDGTTIAVAFVDAKGKPQGTDSLVFAAGTLELPGIRKAYAFEPAIYTAEKDKDGTIAFKATLSSAEHGALLVEGKVVKGVATGKRVWSKPGKPAIEHAFAAPPAKK